MNISSKEDFESQMFLSGIKFTYIPEIDVEGKEEAIISAIVNIALSTTKRF
jgi:hypothetical protein